MFPVENSRFIRPPDALPGRSARSAATLPPRPVDLDSLLARFAEWPGLSAVERSRLVRDSGIVVARSAGLSHREIASAAGVAQSRVGAILGGLSA